MDNNYVIITDSCAELPNEYLEKYQIPVLKFSYYIGDDKYISSNDELVLKDFFKSMREKKTVSTSCVNGEEARLVFEEILNEGKDIIYIGFSSAMSATFQVVNYMASEIRDKYPERTIICVDSLSGCLGLGAIVLYACEQRENGISINNLVEFLKTSMPKMNHLFTVDTLYWLYIGGRVKRTALLLAGALDIKPLMRLSEEGVMVPYGKTVGRKRSLAQLAKKIAEKIENPELQTIYIAHGDVLDDVNFLISKIKELITPKDFVITYVDTVVGAHGGPGTLAVFFVGKDRAIL
ncbi:MAG: DegV family protein [Acholeplasmatales bacterium]|jgi:DegV family protein with EDD domain|nr:DegV family protein [Acholeplasmatales bacterium]